jgi:hypothetical protein
VSVTEEDEAHTPVTAIVRNTLSQAQWTEGDDIPMQAFAMKAEALKYSQCRTDHSRQRSQCFRSEQVQKSRVGLIVNRAETDRPNQTIPEYVWLDVKASCDSYHPGG